MVFPADLEKESLIDKEEFSRLDNDLRDSSGDIFQSSEPIRPMVLEYIQKSARVSLNSTAESLINNRMSENSLNSSDESDILATPLTVTENLNISSIAIKDGNITTSDAIPTLCTNITDQSLAPIGITNLSEIPAKEVIIVLLMLSLWLYAIHMTRRAWQRLLKE